MQQLTSNTLLQGGKYKIEKVLGQGSFGITYLAEHTALGKKVAIKEFFMKEINTRAEDGSITGMSDGSLSYNYAKKFQKEAMNLSRLDHPNIVRVTDSFGENGTFYYVMDYIDGMNLNDYVKRYSPSEKTAVEIIKEAASALLYMHEEKHMLHLDLKPGNIMRRKGDGHIFLIDFGLSKHYDSNGAPETSTNIGLGTPGYAPSEQGNKAKNGEFRPTIDVYALGATLYKLLTRETPPHASEIIDDEDLLADNLRSKDVSESLIAFIVKAMMPSAKKRIQTMQEFVNTLPIASVGKGKSRDTEDNDDDKTQVLGKDETEVIPTAPTPFEESAYVIEEKYKTNPIETNAKATNGDKDAIIALGVMKLRGEGLPQNIGHAHQWFTKAKELGDSRATILINQWDVLKKKYEPEEIYEEEEEEDTTDKHLYYVCAIIIAVIGICVLFNLCSPSQTEQAEPIDTIQLHKEYCDDGSIVYSIKGVAFTMKPVQAGTFMMGATPEMMQYAWEMDKPAHEVTLTKDFYMGQTEVTQELWHAIMGYNPSHNKGDNLPVESVSWYDCQKFITKLNGITGDNFRLPTEAEWEFAARGGNLSNHTTFSGSNDIDEVAWYMGNTQTTRTVAGKKPNELGLYDMSGNIEEHIFDFCDDYYPSTPQTDPIGATYGSIMGTTRGGAFKYSEYGAYNAHRSPSPFKKDIRRLELGLRLALSK